MYSFREFLPARRLGYRNAILTLYRAGYDIPVLLRFARPRPLAVTMPEDRARAGYPAALRQVGIPSLVHTINDPAEAAGLERLGAHGVYTDSLPPR